MLAIQTLHRLTLRAVMALAVLLACMAPAEVGAQDTNIAAELVAEGPAIPGKPLMLAIHFTPKPGWHGYWKNPGDAGYGMQLDWRLPAGWKAGEPLYPVPHQLLINDLMNHVYEGPYAVLVPVVVPGGGLISGSLPISVDAQWLACTDVICVPEQATLRLRLPIAPIASDTARFNRWRAAIPAPLDREAKFEITDRFARIAIPIPASLQLSDPHLYVEQVDLVSYTGKQQFRRQGDSLVGEIPLAQFGDLPVRVSGILAFDKTKGVSFAASPGEVPAGGVLVADLAGDAPPLLVLLLGALAGGLLLNIMPCVFPILSLKAISLARAGESQAQARTEALAYTAGVVLACVALGSLMLALRAAGQQVGWAFQLQHPGVVAALLALAVLITANLAGIFQLPSLSVTRSGEPASAFATGLLAAVVATPCTGPFMAAALGAALLLPPVQALLLFAGLGLGLALPFLLIGFVPALRQLLPRPGAWMETFRRLMAVPMGLTALALLWLAWRMGGPGFALGALAIAGAIVTAAALLSSAPPKGRGLRPLIAAAFVLVAAVLSLGLARNYTPRDGGAEAGLLAATPFSEKALAEARASGKPVFVWFTADWCLTCKVTENVAIEREATREAFASAGVIAIKGDWTRQDPAITAFLTRQGVAGVPLYVWYPASARGQKLDQLLGPDTLVMLAEGSELAAKAP